MCGGWPFGVASQSEIAGDGAIERMAYAQDEQLSRVKGSIIVCALCERQ